MRYYKTSIFTNANEAYRRFLKKRGKKSITQYSTPFFRHPDAKDSLKFQTVNHIWKVGDKYHKLASEYYQDPTMWWVIALYNQKPTEFHVKTGDVIYIPKPLETVLYYIGF